MLVTIGKGQLHIKVKVKKNGDWKQHQDDTKERGPSSGQVIAYTVMYNGGDLEESKSYEWVIPSVNGIRAIKLKYVSEQDHIAQLQVGSAPYLTFSALFIIRLFVDKIYALLEKEQVRRSKKGIDQLTAEQIIKFKKDTAKQLNCPFWDYPDRRAIHKSLCFLHCKLRSNGHDISALAQSARDQWKIKTEDIANFWVEDKDLRIAVGKNLKNELERAKTNTIFVHCPGMNIQNHLCVLYCEDVYHQGG